MAANTNPIFTRTADIQWGPAAIATANTARDGTGTVVTVFTADATEGGYVTRLSARAIGSNVATVLRVFINNGATNATASNNALVAEITCPITTLSEVAALAPIDVPLNYALPAGYKLNCTIGTTIAAGLMLSAFGGKY